MITRRELLGALLASPLVALLPRSVSDTYAPFLARHIADQVYVGTAGILAVVVEDGSCVDIWCRDGELLPLRVKRIDYARTTASHIVFMNGRSVMRGQR